MYQVDWLQTAVAQLTGAWIQADSALRAAMTAASLSGPQRLRAALARPC
jgi:hypothetical protein